MLGIPPLPYTPMPIGHKKPHRKGKDARFELGVALFGLSMLVYLGVAVACLLLPPAARVEAGGVAMPDTGLACLRATRNADYVTVDVPVGTPFRLRTVVLRMDTALTADDATPALQLFAPEVVESETVDCENDGDCEDVALLSSTPDGETTPQVVRFKYRHHLAESSVAYSLHGVGGELFLRGGKQYWLTATHLCYADEDADAARESSHVRARLDGVGTLVASRSELTKARGVRGSPVVDLAETDCGDDTATAELFPERAAIEPNWLRIADMTLYNSEPESVEQRRVVAELGTACATTQTDLERDLMLYQLDCVVSTDSGTTVLCRSDHSLPFRRLATASVHVAVAADAQEHLIATEPEPTLGNLARLSDATTAFLSSLVKLGMITLASAVVYVRSQRASASSSWLFKHAVRTADKCQQGALPGGDQSYTIAQDGLIGVLAITARITISGVRWQTLMEDGQWRVPITEVTAGVFSLWHLGNRYFGFPIQASDPPISKLGGATAIIDSTCAVMVAFAEAPTMGASTGKFNPTARLLTALLISLIVATRCAFSAASCGVLWQTEECLKDRRYGRALVGTGLMWAIVQTTALAIVVVDLFVTPASYSMSRLVPGEALPARMLLFFTLMCAGLPRFMRTVRHILSPADDHKD